MRSVIFGGLSKWRVGAEVGLLKVLPIRVTVALETPHFQACTHFHTLEKHKNICSFFGTQTS